MVKRRLIRIGVTFNRTFYFVDKGVQRGVAYDYGRFIEERLNTALKTGNMKVFVVFVPLPRDMLLPALVDGKVDLVAAQITVTPEAAEARRLHEPHPDERQRDPRHRARRARDRPRWRTCRARRCSSARRAATTRACSRSTRSSRPQGKPPVAIQAAPENLEDDDLLEMVNAGLIPAIVVDDYLANFWKKVFPNLTVHENVAVRTGGSLAVAFRKNSPQLAAALNKFMGNYGLGTSFRQPDRAEVPRQHDVREERRVRRRAQEVPGGRRALPEVQRQVRAWTSC